MKVTRLVHVLSFVAVMAWAETASAQAVVVDGSGIHVNYYTPMYYLNYPVFFNNVGEPIYYVAGEMRYVPRTYVNYRGLRRHHRRHRHNYSRWYRERGHRYRRYRRTAYAPLYHDGYAVYYNGRGLPYYYVNGRTVYIPRHHPRYRHYRTHYHRNGPRYRRWNQRHGQAYRTHRRTAPPARMHRPGRTHRRAARPGYPARRVAPANRRGPARYGHQPVRPGRGYRPGRGVDCRRNPAHASCRRGPRHGAASGHSAPARHQRKRNRRNRRH